MRTGVYQVSGTGSSVCCLLDSANVLHRLRRPSCVRLLWTTCRAVSGCSRGRHQLVTAALRCHGPRWGVALLLLLGHSGLNSTAVAIKVLSFESGKPRLKSWFFYCTLLNISVTVTNKEILDYQYSHYQGLLDDSDSHAHPHQLYVCLIYYDGQCWRYY